MAAWSLAYCNSIHKSNHIRKREQIQSDDEMESIFWIHRNSASVCFINKYHFILVHDVRIVCGCENPELLPLYCNLQIEICVEKWFITIYQFTDHFESYLMPYQMNVNRSQNVIFRAMGASVDKKGSCVCSPMSFALLSLATALQYMFGNVCCVYLAYCIHPRSREWHVIAKHELYSTVHSKTDSFRCGVRVRQTGFWYLQKSMRKFEIEFENINSLVFSNREKNWNI